MFFKKRRINKLKVKVARYEALVESAVRFTKGDTNSYFIDEYHQYVGALAEARAELLILTDT